MRKILQVAIVLISTLNCNAQKLSDFFNKDKTFFEWKKSLLSSADSLPKYDNPFMQNFKSTMNHFSSTIFNEMLDSISKCAKGKMGNYYIILNVSEGELWTTELIMRYYTHLNGCEVRNFVEPEGGFPSINRAGVKSGEYIYSQYSQYRIL